MKVIFETQVNGKLSGRKISDDRAKMQRDRNHNKQANKQKRQEIWNIDPKGLVLEEGKGAGEGEVIEECRRKSFVKMF